MFEEDVQGVAAFDHAGATMQCTVEKWDWCARTGGSRDLVLEISRFGVHAQHAMVHDDYHSYIADSFWGGGVVGHVQYPP